MTQFVLPMIFSLHTNILQHFFEFVNIKSIWLKVKYKKALFFSFKRYINFTTKDKALYVIT